MCCRNFFRFTLICSAFHVLLCSSVMAVDVTSNANTSDIKASSRQSTEKAEKKKTGNSNVKEIKKINNNSANTDSISVSDVVLGKEVKDYVKKWEKAIISNVKSFRKLANKIYSKNDTKGKKLLDFLKLCALRAEIVGDNEKTLQIDLESPITIDETVLLSKTPLDKKNNCFLEINLINKQIN